MASRLRLRRGTSAQVTAFTGVVGEVVVDTTNSRLVLQDGVTAGGIPMAKLSEAGGGMDELVDDTSPQLGGDLDANAFDIQFDDATGIRDDSDNEHLIFQKTASAVNHFEMTNAATGTNPMLSAAGSDSDVSISLQPKGAGVVNVLGTASTQGALRMFEDTDNGSNYVEVKPAASLASNAVLTLPSTTGTLLETAETAVLTKGFTTTAYSIGNSGTGTITPVIANGIIQTLTINGSFTLAAPSDSDSGMVAVTATNDGSGGHSVTISAFTLLSGTYDDTASAVNHFRMTKVGSTTYLEIVN